MSKLNDEGWFLRYKGQSAHPIMAEEMFSQESGVHASKFYELDCTGRSEGRSKDVAFRSISTVDGRGT